MSTELSNNQACNKYIVQPDVSPGGMCMLCNPDLVATNYAMKSTLWFWGENVHINFTDSSFRAFGDTTKNINGVEECVKVDPFDANSSATRRYGFYEDIYTAWNLGSTYGPIDRGSC